MTDTCMHLVVVNSDIVQAVLFLKEVSFNGLVSALCTLPKLKSCLGLALFRTTLCICTLHALNCRSSSGRIFPSLHFPSLWLFSFPSSLSQPSSTFCCSLLCEDLVPSLKKTFPHSQSTLYFFRSGRVRPERGAFLTQLHAGSTLHRVCFTLLFSTVRSRPADSLLRPYSHSCL